MSNITIALAGNPNCGKTTLFNALTGANRAFIPFPPIPWRKSSAGITWSRTIPPSS